MRQLSITATIILLTAGCSTTPLHVDELRKVLSVEVWPGFRPLEANIAVYSDGEILEVASHCKETGTACEPLPTLAQASGDGGYLIPEDVLHGYALYPDLGLLETARLIAHEQFHAHQRSATEFANVTGIGGAPLDVDALEPAWLAAILAGHEHLADLLRGNASPADCQNYQSLLPRSLNDWLLSFERLEGLALYVDLRYGMIATNRDENAVRRTLERELQQPSAKMDYDVFAYIWSAAYLTGAAKAFLHTPQSVLTGHASLVVCQPSRQYLEKALAFLQDSLQERREAEDKWRKSGYLQLIDVSNREFTTTSEKRFYYPWGVMLLGNVHIHSPVGGRGLDLGPMPVAATLLCEGRKPLLVIPITERATARGVITAVKPSDKIGEDLCVQGAQ